jgi:HSP20 family protein
MATNALTKRTISLPSFVNDFFKPWNDWFENGFEKTLSVPAVNITEADKQYNVSVAAPGMKKNDFKSSSMAIYLPLVPKRKKQKKKKIKVIIAGNTIILHSAAHLLYQKK